jgi:phosphate transport system substrate-binding protein
VDVLKIDGKHPTDAAYPSFTRVSLLYQKNHLSPEAEKFIQFSLSETATSVYSAYGATGEVTSPSKLTRTRTTR